MDESAFVDLVADVRSGRQPADSLVVLLAETSAVYAGRGAGEVAKRKGWLLSAFEEAGLPDLALPYVLEELDTAGEPYVAAAAAAALRGARQWEPRFATHLATAFLHMKEFDDALSFAGFRPDWSRGDVTSALDEIVTTLVANAMCPAASRVLRELQSLVDDAALNPTLRRRLRDPVLKCEPGPVVGECCDRDDRDPPDAADTPTTRPREGCGLVGVRAARTTTATRSISAPT